MKKFNVLSLFDGCSCAMIALNRLGIKPDNYFASEIDKYAMQVSKANWPEIKHIGDVSKVHYFEGVLYTESGSYEVSFANNHPDNIYVFESRSAHSKFHMDVKYRGRSLDDL